jgi:hypothetical protein
MSKCLHGPPKFSCGPSSLSPGLHVQASHGVQSCGFYFDTVSVLQETNLTKIFPTSKSSVKWLDMSHKEILYVQTM